MHLINLDVEHEDTPIYRVFHVQRLLELFSARKNVLVRPSMWDDPLENYVLRVATRAFIDHPQSFDFSAKDRFYGQCWSMLSESDAMWRIYSPEKSGVKVSTTVGKLLTSLVGAQEASRGETFIGRVEYLADEVLRDKLQDRFWLSMELASHHSQAASLLFKRLEFKHEEEVRLIYLNHDHGYIDNLVQYSIDPHDLFDEIQFDPRMPAELFEVFRHYLNDTLGYAKPITRSALYRIPDLHL